jgi:hypothetical protein
MRRVGVTEWPRVARNQPPLARSSALTASSGHVSTRNAGAMASQAPLALFYFVWNISRYTDLVGSSVPGYWVGVGFAFWYLSDLFVVGFSRNWGRWLQLAVFPLVLALVIADLVAYGDA